MRRLMLALSLVLMPAFALAQVALVADKVFIRNDKTLVAEGNVEIFQDGTRLRASRIEYNEQRPHDSLGDRTPAEARLQAA